MEYLTDSLNRSWQRISYNSSSFEYSLNPLYRKQTGCYLTSLDLTYQMMTELVNALDTKERCILYQKRFLEPCVGTGNFVFAYLRVCKNLGFSQEENKLLLNNIYVCDVNKEALLVYKENLRDFAASFFGIELDEEYFSTHIGGGLLFDLDSDLPQYIPISDIFPSHIIKNGFDIIATNPPYKNLKAEHSHYVNDEQKNRDKNRYLSIGKLASYYFNYSTSGTLNLYRLFVEEIVEHYLAPDGICSLLIPSSILSDKFCSKIRTRLLDVCSIKSLHLISENSHYVNASQALCAILLQKGKKTDYITINGTLNNDVRQNACVSVNDIIDETTGNSFLVLSDNEYQIRKKMKSHPTIKELGYIDNLRGELDLTMNKEFITTNETPFSLLRGRHIGYYETLQSPEKEFVDGSFVAKTAKNKYIKEHRLVCQQIANMSKKRRISFALVDSNHVLANSCNFISLHENDDDVDIYYLMGILNSTLIDWYFKLTSSNNHINNYEINNFPIPVTYSRKADISILVQTFIATNDETILDKIDALVYEAYGISKSGDSLVESDQALKAASGKRDLILNDFYQDLSCIIKGITKSECQSILDGQATVKDISFQRQPSTNPFERKILENIEKKYQRIYAGQILNHTTFKLSDLDLEMIRPVPQGGSWKDIPQETVQKSKRLSRIFKTGGRTTLYGRIDYSKPSYTITTYFNRPGNGTYVHPVHDRVLSVREAARFQSFPDNYMFFGNKTDMLKQVGNAVPVLMAFNIGKTIREKTGCCTSVDLFSGAGGMTYGFKLAGIKAAIANDFEESACVTLKTNSPEIDVLCGDITKEETKCAIIQAGKNAHADIICGGPPCQGFSLAGFRKKDDPRNELFRHFVDIVSEVNPKVIVFENVEGLLSYQSGETYRNIIELFSELGYNTEGRKLLANHYGVPQKRKRVIILCTRKDLDIMPSDLYPDPVTPNEEHQVTAHETIFDLEKIECSETAKYNSSYSSLMLRYLKNEISADRYVEEVREPHVVTNKGCNEMNAPVQLTLFNL